MWSAFNTGWCCCAFKSEFQSARWNERGWSTKKTTTSELFKLFKTKMLKRNILKQIHGHERTLWVFSNLGIINLWIINFWQWTEQSEMIFFLLICVSLILLIKPRMTDDLCGCGFSGNWQRKNNANLNKTNTHTKH